MTHLRPFSVSAFALIVTVALLAMPVVPRADAQAPAVIINEFLAINESTSTDNSGEYEDWIELHNVSGSTINLEGWTIADGSEVFTFAATTTIGGGEYKVIWASGDTSRSTTTEIHLPFKLSGSGEALTLADADGALSSPAWAAPYPQQLADDSYGVTDNDQLGYFTDPTPGAANGAAFAGLVQPVTFSIDHGFYSSTQAVVLHSATPGTTIRYTTNGESPTATTGTAITPGSAVDIAQTTTLRAVAYRDGWITSPIETRSYLFAADIIVQPETTPPGWPADPAPPNDQLMVYGMNPALVNGNEGQIAASLQAVPTISVVTDLDNFFDPDSGIYVNAREKGREWEVPVSMELFDPQGEEEGFAINAGLRIRGASTRSSKYAKHNFGFFFRDEYGGDLSYPLFGSEGVDQFEKIDLRTAMGTDWARFASTEMTMLRELWYRDTQRDMGQPYTRTRYYNLFINGQYWGLYLTQERVGDSFGESYFSGNESDYDAMKHDYDPHPITGQSPSKLYLATDGDGAAWESLHPLVIDQVVTDAEFAVLDDQVDLVNLADYYLLHIVGGSWDGAPDPGTGGRSNNWFALRNRTGIGPAGKWMFFHHDQAASLCDRESDDTDSSTPWDLTSGGYVTPDYMAPPWLHQSLLTHPTYVQIFKDRVQTHLVDPGGALRATPSIARIDARVMEMEGAIPAHAARWGDADGSVPTRTTADWQAEIQQMRDCITSRQSLVEAQLREDGLWPLADPPTISPGGGLVPYGTSVEIDADGQQGTLYYTTDGSDPRGGNDDPSTTAAVYVEPITIVDTVTIKARVDLGNGIWSTLTEAAFSLSTPAGPVPMALNEFNAVSASNYLGGGTAADSTNGTDVTLGRVPGNGGDWFELIVIQDHLDIRGWTTQIWDSSSGIAAPNATLTFTDDDLLSDLRAGTIITVSEDIADDPTYNPIQGDWHINLQSNNATAGNFFTAGTQTNFAINNDDTQIALYDAAGVPMQLRTGEATAPGIAINKTEVFKLEAAPTFSLAPDSPDYGDGTTSTWGQPNQWAPATTQDLTGLRVLFGDVDCDGQITIGDALLVAQYTVGTRTPTNTCPLPDPTTQLYQAAADVNGDDQADIGDALLIAQCTVGIPNYLCPRDNG